MRVRDRQCGHTLVELTIALVVGAIVAGFALALIAAPPAALQRTERRASLSDDAQHVMAALSRDLRQALPNSIRFSASGAVLVIEQWLVLDDSRLLPEDGSLDDDEQLELGVPDTEFETLGEFRRIQPPWSSDTAYVALHHDGSAGANAWNGTDVITSAGTRIRVRTEGGGGRSRVTLSPAATFTSVGATRRVYLLESPVTWLCDRDRRRLSRYIGYAPSADQSRRDSDAELIAAGARREDHSADIADCRITRTRTADDSQSAYQITIAFSRAAETLRLTSQQVHDHGG